MTNEEIADRLFQRVESMIGKALGPVLERLESLEGIEVPTAADVAKTILAGEEIKTLVDLHVSEAVQQIEPPKDGKDATEEDVRKAVSAYLKENPPEKGRDGLDLKDLFRADGGHLIAVMSDGTTKDLGVFVGKNGKDGADFTETSFDYDGERTLTIRGRGGEVVKNLPIPLDRGYYREGMKAEKGDILTHDGNAWLALKDTSAKPCTENKDDWRIFARKGRDGRDGKDGKAPPGPVRLSDG